MLSRGGRGAAAVVALGFWAAGTALTVNATEQKSAAAASAGAKPSDPFVGQDFPRTPGDPAAIARGKQVYSVNCGFCHGSDARGGEVGPNLLRSAIVMNDQKGELIAAIVLNGRVERGMPKFNLSVETIADLAAFVHSIHVGREQAAVDPKDLLVGNAVAGKAYFYGKGGCSACHSVTGDLAGIGAKYNPKTLQDNIVSGGAVSLLGTPLPTAPPRTVTITLPSGEVIRGNLISSDDFNVSLTDSDGNRRTLRRDGDSPRVEIKNPLQAHLDMLRQWEDRDIHNLTAFLVKQK